MKYIYKILLLTLITLATPAIQQVLGQTTPTVTSPRPTTTPEALGGQSISLLKTPAEAARTALNLINSILSDTDFTGPGLHPGVLTDLSTLENSAKDVIQDNGKDLSVTTKLVNTFVASINQNISRLNSIARRDTETQSTKDKCHDFQVQLTNLRVSFHPDTPNKTTNPSTSILDTATSRLEACQMELQKALTSINKANAVNHGGFIEKTRMDTALAIADLKAAIAYVNEHPEIDSLKTGLVNPDQPKFAPISIPAYDIGPNGKGKSPFADSALNSLNAAIQPLIDEPKGDTPVLLLGELGGNRNKIIEDIRKTLTDLIAAFEFAHNNPAPPAVNPLPAPAAASTT